jgi:hypothetical protein
MMKDEKEFLIPTDIDPATGKAKAFLLTEEALDAWLDELFAAEVKEILGGE